MPILTEVESKLTAKLGPLPAWGWVVAGVGGVLAFRLLRKVGSTTGQAGVYDLNAASGDNSGGVDSGGGGGSVTTPPVTTTPPPDQTTPPPPDVPVDNSPPPPAPSPYDPVQSIPITSGTSSAGDVGLAGTDVWTWIDENTGLPSSASSQFKYPGGVFRIPNGASLTPMTNGIFIQLNNNVASHLPYGGFWVQPGIYNIDTGTPYTSSFQQVASDGSIVAQAATPPPYTGTAGAFSGTNATTNDAYANTPATANPNWWRNLLNRAPSAPVATPPHVENT